MKRFLIILVLLLLLVACGGNTATEPAANTGNTNTENAAETADTDAGADVAEEPEDTATEAPTEPAAEDPAEETAADDAGAEEAAGGEDVASEEDPAMEEEAMDIGGEEMPLSGIDPETGLEINPDEIPRGVEFIALGEVISMNLTPQSSPEFVIQSPNGVNYRMATQAVSDIYLSNGEQLQPFEYQIGMTAMATAFLAPEASLSDVLTTDDLIIISLP